MELLKVDHQPSSVLLQIQQQGWTTSKSENANSKSGIAQKKDEISPRLSSSLDCTSFFKMITWPVRKVAEGIFTFFSLILSAFCCCSFGSKKFNIDKEIANIEKLIEVVEKLSDKNSQIKIRQIRSEFKAEIGKLQNLEAFQVFVLEEIVNEDAMTEAVNESKVFNDEAEEEEYVAQYHAKNSERYQKFFVDVKADGLDKALEKYLDKLKDEKYRTN